MHRLVRASGITVRLIGLAVVAISVLPAADPGRDGPVEVNIYENLAEEAWLAPAGQEPVSSYTEPAFGFVRIPTRYSANALALDRSEPFTLQATISKALPAGTYEFRMRSKGLSRFLVDGKEILRTKAQQPNKTSNDLLPPEIEHGDSPVRPAPYPHQEVIDTVELDGKAHKFEFLAVIGGKGLTPSPAELSVSYGRAGEIPRLLGGDHTPLLTDGDWEAYQEEAVARHESADIARARAADDAIELAWQQRHEKVRAWLASQPAVELPEPAHGISGGNNIDRFLDAKLMEAGISPTDAIGDLEFLRRITIDATGLVPTTAEIRAYLAESAGERRAGAIDRLLESPSWADNWVPYWQDVLAENPGILKPDLNNTGPFRWWLHQAFRENLPFDRIVTEIVEMEGSLYKGAPRGFAMASLNDAPMAAKADILSQAFLASKLSCARCHDAPFHPFKQHDLFSMAAMLQGKPLKLPVTSTIPVREGGRKPYVQVSLKPGDEIEPHWPFAEMFNENAIAEPPNNTSVTTRHLLATLIVAPSNQRFGQVIVNRIWKRYMGRGLVEPTDDWSKAEPSHPELLRYLSREFLASGYDVKHLARLIFQSRAYQRRPVRDEVATPTKAGQLFAGPFRRRMSAEQVVDSLHQVAGKPLDCEELNLNPLGDRSLKQFLNMGIPRRAWELTALSNERDRPSLALPRAQALVDVMSTFGWRQSRQNPATDRDDGASPMQTLVLANGATGTRIARLSDESFFTRLSLEDRPLDGLIEEVYLRVLSRPPSGDEVALFRGYLEPYYDGRKVDGANPETLAAQKQHKTDERVSWANHMDSKATLIRMEEERKVRMGDDPTELLKPEFRERMEDAVWALINSPEFNVIP